MKNDHKLVLGLKKSMFPTYIYIIINININLFHMLL